MGRTHPCIRVPDETDTDEHGRVRTLCGVYRHWGGTVSHRAYMQGRVAAACFDCLEAA